MDTRKVAAEYRLAQWSQALRERKENDETVNAFCVRKCISKNTYFYWQKKLRKVACEELILKEGEHLPVPNGWAVCEAKPENKNIDEVIVEVGKFKLSVNENTNPELLAKTCKVLVSLC
jgi:hypothetical protein